MSNAREEAWQKWDGTVDDYHPEESIWKAAWDAATATLQQRVSELEAELSDVRYAAHMPADYQFGLASWVNQFLYAAWIGLQWSPGVMEMIRDGRLTFPDAPVYAERDAARAQLAEARLDGVRAGLAAAFHRFDHYQREDAYTEKAFNMARYFQSQIKSLDAAAIAAALPAKDTQ